MTKKPTKGSKADKKDDKKPGAKRDGMAEMRPAKSILHSAYRGKTAPDN